MQCKLRLLLFLRIFNKLLIYVEDCLIFRWYITYYEGTLEPFGYVFPRGGEQFLELGLGEWDTRTDPDCSTLMNGERICAPNHIDIEVEKGIIHEQFAPASVDQKNDIALVRLKRSVRCVDPYN